MSSVGDRPMASSEGRLASTSIQPRTACFQRRPASSRMPSGGLVSIRGQPFLLSKARIAMSPGPLVVTFDAPATGRAAVAEAIGGAADIIYLPDLPDGERAGVLRSAGALLARNTTELKPDELALIGGARLFQSFTAGVDFIRFGVLPPGLPLAANPGAFAEPMAEHAVAMA